jgi:hypothetical protein
MLVWLSKMVFGPVFLDMMLILAKGTPMPNTCSWLGRWFDWPSIFVHDVDAGKRHTNA